MLPRKLSTLKNVVRITTCTSSSYAGLRPRRSLLYVPGNEEKKVRKAAGLQADAVVLDCEDGVALNKKVETRHAIQKWLPSTDFGKSECVVRINSIDTEFASDDLESVLTSPHLPDAIMVPKIDTAEQISWLFNASEKLLESRKDHKLIKVIGQSETPLSLMNLRQIMEEASKENNYLKFEAFVFGSDDYLASIGATRTKDANELLFARQYFIMHVKGFGMQAVDMVDINFKDLDGLKDQAEKGAKMGFTGKQIIHPAQIDVVNTSFSPSPKDIQYAEELVTAFDEHQLSGKGAFSFRGAMIDMPSVKQAQNVLNVSRLISNT